jgi:hypothetical protein
LTIRYRHFSRSARLQRLLSSAPYRFGVPPILLACSLPFLFSSRLPLPSPRPGNRLDAVPHLDSYAYDIHYSFLLRLSGPSVLKGLVTKLSPNEEPGFPLTQCLPVQLLPFTVFVLGLKHIHVLSHAKLN